MKGNMDGGSKQDDSAKFVGAGVRFKAYRKRERGVEFVQVGAYYPGGTKNALLQITPTKVGRSMEDCLTIGNIHTRTY